MSDGLFALWGPWPYQLVLSRRPEPEEEQPVDGRIAGLVDESN